MALVAQGTVQLKVTKGRVTLVLSPISDYKVRNEGKDYTVFVEANYKGKGSPKCRVFLTKDPFEVDVSLRQTLIQAALGPHMIQVEINGGTTKIAKITGLQFPVVPPSQ